uniref:Putative conserved protein with signal anchor n=1 Tax=Ixodes ricinus TaxID=34613 RepID=A0A6B0UER2_IXORI
MQSSSVSPKKTTRQILRRSSFSMFLKRYGKLCNSPSCRNRLTRAGEFGRNPECSQGYGMVGATIELNVIIMAPFCLFLLLRASVAHDVSNVASRRSAVST